MRNDEGCVWVRGIGRQAKAAKAAKAAKSSKDRKCARTGRAGGGARCGVPDSHGSKTRVAETLGHSASWCTKRNVLGGGAMDRSRTVPVATSVGATAALFYFS